MAEAIICDLDEVLVPPRIIKITGKKDKITREIDVTEIPSRVILELIRNEERLRKKISRQNDDIFSWMMGIAIDICKPSFPQINENWIIDNMDWDRMQRFLKFVLEPINQFLEKAAEEAKKTLAAQNEV